MDNPAGAAPRAKVVTVDSVNDSFEGSVARQSEWQPWTLQLLDVAKMDGREGVPVDVLEHLPDQPPGTSAGSTSPIRRQPFDSSHVRGAATSGGRSASA